MCDKKSIQMRINNDESESFLCSVSSVVARRMPLLLLMMMRRKTMMPCMDTNNSQQPTRIPMMHDDW